MFAGLRSFPLPFGLGELGINLYLVQIILEVTKAEFLTVFQSV
jgi:hypothetical protein